MQPQSAASNDGPINPYILPPLPAHTPLCPPPAWASFIQHYSWRPPPPSPWVAWTCYFVSMDYILYGLVLHDCNVYCDIYELPMMYILLGFHIRDWQKTGWNTPSSCARVMTHNKGAILCRVSTVTHDKDAIFCHVPWLEHMANIQSLLCATLGHMAKRASTSHSVSILFFTVSQGQHTAKCLPCARELAHGKEALCRPLIALPWGLCRV